MRGTFITALVAVFAFCLDPPVAAGDRLVATLGGPVKEKSHVVNAKIENGVVTFVVRRTFSNSGKRHEEAVLDIDLPYGAVATGLRIRAGKVWYKGDLMERNEAADLYQELTGIGPHRPKDPALLEWQWSDSLALRVFPILPGKSSTVEYTLTAPSRYENGKYFLSYPKGADGENLVSPVIRVRPQSPRATVTVDGVERTPGKPVTLEADEPLSHPFVEGAASFATSDIDVTRGGVVSTISLSLDIRHTYKSDLRAQLVTPQGRRYIIHDRDGGSENHIRELKEVELAPPEPLGGVWQLVVSDHQGMDVGTIEGWSLFAKIDGKTVKHIARDTPKFIPDAPTGEGTTGIAVIQVSPPKIKTVSTRLGKVVAAEDSQYVRLEVDAAPELRALPKRHLVVFVMDASHTMGEEGINAQLSVARAYLSHVPDARFEIVLFRRKAARLFGRFARAIDFERMIAEATDRLDPGNGSALDEGLEVATDALVNTKGSRHLVFLTDALLRSSFENSAALKILSRLSKKVVVHSVIPERYGAVEESRDDSHFLSPLAAAHGGIIMRLSGILEEDNRKDLEGAVLGLVRPVRIDDFHIEDKSFDLADEVPSELVEGDGFREMLFLDKAPSSVTLAGKIWAKPFRRVVSVTPSFNRATAGFVFSHDMHDALSVEEMDRVARFGRAVSPVTSYLAVEPGVRPSVEGIGRGGGGSGEGTIGLGHLSTIGHGGGARRAATVDDLLKMLKETIEQCESEHRPEGEWRASVTVETTFFEIVDVIPEVPSPFANCIVEGTWKLRLDSHFFKKRDRFELTLTPDTYREPFLSTAPDELEI